MLRLTRFLQYLVALTTVAHVSVPSQFTSAVEMQTTSSITEQTELMSQYTVVRESLDYAHHIRIMHTGIRWTNHIWLFLSTGAKLKNSYSLFGLCRDTNNRKFCYYDDEVDKSEEL